MRMRRKRELLSLGDGEVRKDRTAILTSPSTTSPELEEISSSILSAVKSRAPRKKVKRAGDIYYLRPDGW